MHAQILQQSIGVYKHIPQTDDAENDSNNASNCDDEPYGGGKSCKRNQTQVSSKHSPDRTTTNEGIRRRKARTMWINAVDVYMCGITKEDGGLTGDDGGRPMRRPQMMGQAMRKRHNVIILGKTGLIPVHDNSTKTPRHNVNCSGTVTSHGANNQSKERAKRGKKSRRSIEDIERQH